MLNSEASRSDSVTGRWDVRSEPVSRGNERTWVRRRQAVLLLAGACLIIATAMLLVHSLPDFLSWDRVLRAGWPSANLIARAWRLNPAAGSLLLSVLAFAIMLLCIVISNEVARRVWASLCGMKVERTAVESYSDWLPAPFRGIDQTVKICRQFPYFTLLVGDSGAFIHRGSWKRHASGLAGSFANLGLALLIAWIIAGLQGAVLGLHVMRAGFLTFGLVILSPFASGILADFVAGPLQEPLAVAQADGLGWLGTWWVLLSTMFAAASLFNLHR